MNQLTVAKLPFISVLLPVYNAAPYLPESLDSIVEQSHTNLELVAIDDGSTDESWEILTRYAQQDRRISIYQNKKNIGLIETLNRGLSLCEGDYIARMDADDIAHSKRLEKQLAMLKKHPNCRFCGTLHTFFPLHPNPAVKWLRRLELQSKYIRPRALFYTPLAHPSFMAEREFYQSFQYDRNYPVAEDYELLTRMLCKADGVIVPEILIKMRLSASSHSTKYKETQLQSVRKIYQNQFDDYRIDYTEKEMDIHMLTSESQTKFLTPEELKQVDSWLQKLEQTNVDKAIFDQQIFREVLAIVWLRCCQRAALSGYSLVRSYNSSPYAKSIIPTPLKWNMYFKSTVRASIRRFQRR